MDNLSLAKRRLGQMIKNLRIAASEDEHGNLNLLNASKALSWGPEERLILGLEIEVFNERCQCPDLPCYLVLVVFGLFNWQQEDTAITCCCRTTGPESDPDIDKLLPGMIYQKKSCM